jgi:hypothetical protein
MYVNVAQINPQQSRFSQCLSKGCVPHVLRLTVAITTDEEEDFLLLLLLLLELFFVAVVAEAAEESLLLLRRRAAEGDGLDGEDDDKSSSMDETGEMTVEEAGCLTLFLRCIIVG